MSEMSFGDLVKTAESGGAATIPAGDYDVKVTDARPKADSSMIFVTFGIQNGPQMGKQVDIGLFFPRPDNKPGAHRIFARKFAAFVSYPDVKAACIAADNAPSLEQGFTVIGNSLIGKEVSATISIRKEGDYAGTTDLVGTKPMGGPIAAQPVGATPAATPPQDAQPASVGPGTPF